MKIINVAGNVSYSKVVRLSLNDNFSGRVKVFPNPVTDKLQVRINAPVQQTVELSIYDAAGRLMRKLHTNIEKGNSKITISNFQSWPTGIYSVKVVAGKELFINKMVLKK